MKVSGFKKVGIIAAVAVIGFAFTACGNGANGPEEELPGNGPDGGWQGRSPVIQLDFNRIDLGTWASGSPFSGTGVSSETVAVTIFNLQEYAHLGNITVIDNANRYAAAVTGPTPTPTPPPPHEEVIRSLQLEVRNLPGGNATPTSAANNHLGVNTTLTSGSIAIGTGTLHDFAARGNITFTVNASRVAAVAAGTTTVQLVLQEVTTRGAGTPSVRTLATAPLTIVLHDDD